MFRPKRTISLILALIIVMSCCMLNTAALLPENVLIGDTDADESQGNIYGMLGDVDESLLLNVKDVTLIQKYLAKIVKSISNKAMEFADVDFNGIINVKDATAIQKHLAKYPSDLNIGSYIYVKPTESPAKPTDPPASDNKTVAVDTEATPFVTTEHLYFTTTAVVWSEFTYTSEAATLESDIIPIYTTQSFSQEVTYPVVLPTDTPVPTKTPVIIYPTAVATDPTEAPVYTKPTVTVYTTTAWITDPTEAPVYTKPTVTDYTTTAWITDPTEPPIYTEPTFIDNTTTACVTDPIESTHATEYFYLESDHPYSDNTDKTWYIHRNGASAISITFSEETYVENSYDYIYIYNEHGDLVGKYTGYQLAGETITVEGEYLSIRLTSDSSDNRYGFAITNVFADYYEDTATTTSVIENPTSAIVTYPTELDTTSASVDMINVYLTNNEGWDDVKVFYWGGASSLAWPGEAMEFVKVNSYGQSIYKAEIPADADYFLFNGKSSFGTLYRTVDIEVIGDNKGYYLLDMDADDNWNVAPYDITTDEFETTAADVDMISIYFVKPSNWEGAYLYSYYGDGKYMTALWSKAYPGNPMEFVETDAYGNAIYRGDVPADINVIKFADGSTINLRTDIITAFRDGICFQVSEEYETNKWYVEEYNSEETTATEAPETTVTEAPETTATEAPETTATEVPETTATDAPDTTAAYEDYFYPESDHPYSSGMDKSWYINRDGATKIWVEFSDDTFVETNYDYIYIYDVNNSLVGKYSGSELAGETISVDGDLVRIRLTSDSSITKYGFAVTDIYATFPIVPPTEVEIVPVGLQYSIDPTANAVEITGYTGSDTEIIIPSRIEGYPVTSIGELAFHGCDTLVKVVVPGSVTNIGESAFSYCDSLSSVTLSEGLNFIGDSAFQRCEALESIVFPDSLIRLEEYSFAYCEKLADVYIPENVEYIDYTAFISCIGINSITVDENNSVYDSRNNCNAIIETATNTLVKGCVCTLIPSTVTTIGYYAFYYCKGLLYISIPDSVTSIEDSAFYGSDIQGITLSDNLRSIGSCAFFYCSDLKSLYIPESVENLGVSVLGMCDSLVEIIVDENNLFFDSRYDCNAIIETDTATLLFGCSDTVIPDGITAIGNKAFSYCSGLTSIVIPDSVTTIGNYAFSGCDSLTKVFIPYGVTSLGECAFEQCRSLADITLPDSIVSIGYEAFYDCESLTNITLPDSLTTIGDMMFGCCDGLKSVTIPESVSLIDYFAFYGCYNLTYVYYAGTEEQWSAITIKSNNDDLLNATILYDIYPESDHSYSSNTDKSWTITRYGATSIKITFSEDTFVESGFDYIYLYDENDNLLGKYSGSELAGKSISVNGEMVRIRLTSDGSVTKYGFAVTGVVADYSSSSTADDGYTVYVINSDNWSEVSAFAWTSGSEMPWPGLPMTKTGDTVNGFDVYSITFDTLYSTLIFNNNNNGSQTSNLKFETGKYYDVKSAKWYASLSEVPAVGATSTDRYLAGDFNDWNTVSHEFMLEAEGDSVAYVEIELEAYTTYEFMVVRLGDWTTCDTAITDTVTGLQFSKSATGPGSNGNAIITTKDAGTYVFAFGMNDSKLSVYYP